jgi:hypothetical protein
MRNLVETQAYIKLRRKICVTAGNHIVRGKKFNTLKEKTIEASQPDITSRTQ